MQLNSEGSCILFFMFCCFCLENREKQVISNVKGLFCLSLFSFNYHRNDVFNICFVLSFFLLFYMNQITFLHRAFYLSSGFFLTFYFFVRALFFLLYSNFYFFCELFWSVFLSWIFDFSEKCMFFMESLFSFSSCFYFLFGKAYEACINFLLREKILAPDFW